MIECRAATAGDREAIRALRRRCFPNIDQDKQSPAFAEWEFEDSPQGPAAVVIASDGERCLSHIALIPQQAIFGGELVRAALAVDAMTDTSVRSQGLYSRILSTALATSRDDFDLAFAYQNRRNVLGAMLRNDWRIAGRYPVLVRPLTLRGIVSGGTDPLLHVNDEAVRLLTGADASIMSECARRMTLGDAFYFPRSREWITWRFFERPSTTYRVTGVFSSSSGALAAWLVARRMRLRGIDSIAIADLAFVDEKAAILLIDDALLAASAHSVGVGAAFLSPAHRAHALLRRKHFFPSPHRFRLLVRTFDDAFAAATSENWPVIWADTDHL